MLWKPTPSMDSPVRVVVYCRLCSVSSEELGGQVPCRPFVSNALLLLSGGRVGGGLPREGDGLLHEK
jgi:hypothetical protein